jgi:hypothetical protein
VVFIRNTTVFWEMMPCCLIPEEISASMPFIPAEKGSRYFQNIGTHPSLLEAIFQQTTALNTVQL